MVTNPSKRRVDFAVKLRVRRMNRWGVGAAVLEHVQVTPVD